MSPKKSVDIPEELIALARRLWPDARSNGGIRRHLRICEALRVLAFADGVDWLLPADAPAKESILAELGHFCDRDLVRLARELCDCRPTVKDALRWLRALRNGPPTADPADLQRRLLAMIDEYVRWHDGADPAFARSVVESLFADLVAEAEPVSSFPA